MAAQQKSRHETIVEHIIKDHQETAGAIRELETRVRGRRDDTLDPVFVPMKQELLGHMAAEEKLLYPPLEKTMKKQIADAKKEHDEIRKHLDDLAASGSMTEAEWTRHLGMMKQAIEHHVREEEGEILPAAREIFDEKQLVELGTEFERMEKEHR